jgi:LacI family transcriptional regulator
LKRSGHECVWLRWHESPDYRNDRDQWKRKRKWILSQLQPAPKPLAVFAANDEQALDVLECCQDAGLSVPEQIAVVGA